ncbi:aspartate aminotransferase family protein [Alcanivorax sp. JB21]|uniref:aspartate aminotransferase family protein n=1 Tax=Alcanivorax limicola TaxID=2874102 RepID=UPI001CBE6AB3|nr:aspartate aminotransferase family protein [Alcanivorax limicola]MBZ2189797.1 aspartate aminotransferase family protein [Alcanivorax limicola]
MNDNYLMPTYARQPLNFSRGEGVWLYDTDGQAYLDGVSGIAVCNLGHCHPAVTRALTRQAASLVHTSNLYRVEHQESLAAALCQVSGMARAFFCNSGAEANEAAIKIARLYGNRRKVNTPTIVVLENAFHGRTMATLTATGNAKAQAGFEPLVSGFVRAPWNDVDAIRALADSHDNIVAVLVEPVQGEGGVRIPAPDYLARLRQLCDEKQWLLMLDEVQSGNGRTGSYFACSAAGVVPDVLTTAKGLGNGFPIGACLVSGAAEDVFGPGSHGSTYGGNPLGCATALAVVDTLTREVIPSVNAKGALLQQRLREALSGVAMVQDIRGQGLIIGVELDRDCPEIVALARDRGLLVNVTAGRVIRLLPPLVINDEEIALLVERVADAVRAFVRQQEAA